MNMMALRKSAGLTQEEVARRLGITTAAVSLWETGKTKPRADALIALAKLYGCTVDDILKEVST